MMQISFFTRKAVRRKKAEADLNSKIGKAARRLGKDTLTTKAFLDFERERLAESKRKGCITVIIIAIIFTALGFLLSNLIFNMRTAHAQSCPELNDQSNSNFVGAFGVVENDLEYTYARAQALDPEGFHKCRITVYGPPHFPTTNNTARWIDGDPLTVQEGLDWASELGIDGICAASPGTPWYSRIRDDMPPILYVEGHGVYLCVDRMARRVWGGIDLWVADPHPGGTYFANNNIQVWEITSVQNTID